MSSTNQCRYHRKNDQNFLNQDQAASFEFFDLIPLSHRVGVLAEFAEARHRIGLSNYTEVIEMGNQLAQKNSIKLAHQLIEALRPWRKGPYEIEGRKIESEWDSELKWQRILPHLPRLEGKKICDLGCNNGYFIFKLFELETKPDFVLGLDPVVSYYLQYCFLKLFHPPQPHRMELVGYAALKHFPSKFDLIFCMGILYHHANPLEILKLIHQALTPSGEVIIDCQGIPSENRGDENLPVVLFPKKRYLNKSGFWFLPNPEALENWLYRTGFSSVEWMDQHQLSTSEQGSRVDSPFSSLSEGLSDNREKTIEGYPRPMRYYLKAKK